MQVGVGVQKGADNRNYVILDVMQDNVKILISLTDEVNYEHDIDALIAGLQQMKRDMKTAESGLVIAKEVPNGIRPSQSGSTQRPSRPSKGRSRPATG